MLFMHRPTAPDTVANIAHRTRLLATHGTGARRSCQSRLRPAEQAEVGLHLESRLRAVSLVQS